MSATLVLDHDQVREALSPDLLLPAVRTALIATSREEASTPPRIAAYSPAGVLGAMPGYVPGLGMAGKFVSIFRPDGPGRRSSHQGVVALFDENDGRLLALMNGEAITAKRTAASATVAYQALAPSSVATIAVIGAGVQAVAQLELLAELGVGGEVVAASRTPRSAADVAERFGITAAPTIQEAASAADVVFCCTDADQPVIQYSWLRTHAHVSSVGGSSGPELDHLTASRGSLFVEWPGAVSSAPPAGAHELQDIPRDHATLLGSVLSGARPGRAADELTVFKSTGYAALDVAAAAAAYQAATAHELGMWIDL
jgi:ornithine cyclodeaminase/alanine dehydrogenase-like protein (mu-crystallin family)